MGTCRILWTEAACTSSSSVCIRSLGPWHLSGLAVGLWLVWAPCSSSDNMSTPTTAVCGPAVATVPTPQRPSSSYVSLFFCLLSWLLWDNAEVVARLPVRNGRRADWQRYQEKSVPECHRRHAEEQLPSCAQGLRHGWKEGDMCQTFKTLSFSCFHQLVAELVAKWKSYPEAQHTPLCAHQLVLAMKTITQLALGESCSDDARVISFRKNHDAVSHPGFLGLIKGCVHLEMKCQYLQMPPDLVGDWEGLHGRFIAEELQQKRTLRDGWWRGTLLLVVVFELWIILELLEFWLFLRVVIFIYCVPYFVFQLCQRWSPCCCRWWRRGSLRGGRQCLWTRCFSPTLRSGRWKHQRQLGNIAARSHIRKQTEMNLLLFQILEDSMVFTLAGCAITANCEFCQFCVNARHLKKRHKYL